LGRIAVITAIAAGSAPRVHAQSGPRTIRGDVAATVGWLSVDAAANSVYDNNNWVSSLFGTVEAGWHWTDNIKTEIDFGTGTKATTYRTEPVTINGRPTYQTTRTTFSRRTLALAPQYQFFHNAWFHPHLGAGATITWEHAISRGDPIFVYDVVNGAGTVAPGALDEPRTSVTVRPFVTSGFKAYMNERAFFRSDIRMTFRGGPDEVLLRVGFGVDF
jgi:outer membrane protein W